MSALAVAIVVLCAAELRALPRDDMLYIENHMPLQEFEQPPVYAVNSDAEAMPIKLE